ncbi:hypothetical protein [Achromobacter anxifer]|uniref:hypothetical protein n=1 Tax=Achromobacter anxifer TaxID=1287737 RepID=UPI001591A2D0|nr:hypothetical protein [Achromobacter anxifer]
MSKQGAMTADEVMNKIQDDLARSARDREVEQQQARARLRDQDMFLREPVASRVDGPGSLSSPAFKLTATPHYPGVAEPGQNRSDSGHLSPAAEAKFLEHIKDAGNQTSPARRDSAVAKAARVAAHDWDQKHGHGKAEPGVVTELRREARAQMMFAAREIGEKVGLDPAASSVIGYSLERALEKEGFRVLASHAVDKLSDVFRATTASVTTSTGMRHTLENNLNQSMNWLAAHGVTRDAFKEVLRNHSGKFTVIAEMASNPEALRRAAYLISKSDHVLDGVMAAASDKELRKALGSVTMATGEAISTVGARSVGSVAIVAGAVMRGDSAADTSRHIFRAALSVLGGAAGGLGGGMVSAGFGSVAGAVVGAELGSRLADKLLSFYDRIFAAEGAQQKSTERMVSNDELKHSTDVIGQRAGTAAKTAVGQVVESTRDRGMERTMERSTGMSG